MIDFRDRGYTPGEVVKVEKLGCFFIPRYRDSTHVRSSINSCVTSSTGIYRGQTGREDIQDGKWTQIIWNNKEKLVWYNNQNGINLRLPAFRGIS